MQTPSFSSSAAHLSLGQRLLRVLHDPGSAYEAVRDEPGWHDWAVPILLVGLLTAASTYLTLPLMDPETPEVRDQLARLTPEQRAQTVEWVQMVRSHGWLTLPIVNGFATVATVSMVLLGLARWVFRSDVGVREMLVVTAYSSMVQGVEAVVRTPFMLASHSLVVHMGPGALVSEEMAATYLGRLLINVDLFGIWQVWLMGVGLGILANVPMRRSLIAVALLWGLWVVFAAASLSTQAGPA